jgi:hypothetical protein
MLAALRAMSPAELVMSATPTTVHGLLAEGASLAAIASHLDGLDPAARLAQCRALGRADQRKLYNLATAELCRLEDLVPAAVAPRTEVIQSGQNTLPLPGILQRFEKRFCRPDDGTDRLFGYNEGVTRSWIGPGCFVAYATDDNKDWLARGGVVVDYFKVPDGAVVDGWPKVVSNSRGLQFFVYNGTRDFMRKVSRDVTIGAAYKGEKPLDHYFVLVRNP